MNKEWLLDSLYKSFQDEAFTLDVALLSEKADTLKTYITNLSSKGTKEELKTVIGYMEEFSVLFDKLYSYTSLRQATNTTDSETTSLIGKLEKVHSSIAKEMSILDKYIAGIENLDELLKEEDLKGYDYYLNVIKENAKYTLSDDVEEVIAKLNLSAGSAWSTMQEYLTSTVEVDYKGETVTLPSIRNLAYSGDKEVRKSAYEAELAAYKKIKDPIAFSLNNIKMQVNTIVDLRGYESALDLTLKKSHMKKETLDAMFEAIMEYLPKFHEYLKRKASLLGHEKGLPWYDLFAPMGSLNQTFTTEEAKDYLIKNFIGFSQDLADMVTEAFDDAWIDFFPHAGKVGGAFCANLPFIKQSRILTNFDGSLSDVVTLAHELGHAYHGLHIQEHLPLNTNYSMPVAETASNFNEIIIMEAAIKDADDKGKLTLIESQLQDVTQIICDIYSRYLFETAVFDKSKEGFLFADELEQIMLDCQKQAYGEGLDHTALHPYMWVCKGHYYSENLSFYNFPYAFGGLFARGLYAKYLEEGSAFVPKYQALLNATTVKSVEDVAAMAGIDLTKPDFFRNSLKTVADSIDAFLELTK